MCNENRFSESGAPIAPTRCKEYVALASDRDRLAGVVAGMEEQNARNLDALEQERVRLAGCGVATMGYGNPASPGDYGWSESYGSVLNLRKRFDSVKEENARLREALKKAESWADRIHSALAESTRPKQAVGEMVYGLLDFLRSSNALKEVG